MKTHNYVITFAIKSKAKRERITEYLHEGECIEITPTSFYFESPKDVMTVQKELMEIRPVSLSDVFYVFSIRSPWTGIGCQELNDRLKSRRPR